VAVGGIQRYAFGSPVPVVCFCRLIYDHDGRLITSDFMKTMEHGVDPAGEFARE
jgi:hypothetical protein